MKQPNKTNCRRSLPAFCIILLLSSICSGQDHTELYCIAGKKYTTGKNSISESFSSYISPPVVYYITDEDWNAESRDLSLNMINTESGKKDSFILHIPTTIIINELPDISLNSDYLILTDDEQFSLYRFKKSGKQFNFVNEIKLPEKCSGKNVKYLSKNKFLLYCFYNFHPSDNTYNSNLGIYDAEKDSIIRFIHPEMPCIGFSHFPKEWLTNNDNTIALASPCGYKIDFYNFNLELKGSINPQTSEIKNYRSIDKISFETSPDFIHPKLLIEKMLLLKDTVSRIEKIYFVNNSTLLVSSTGKDLGNDQRRIDLWDIDHKLKPVFCNAKNRIEVPVNDTLDPEHLPIPINSCDDLEIKNNIIYAFNNEDYISDKKIKMSDFLQLKNQYYETNDPIYSIQQFILPRIPVH